MERRAELQRFLDLTERAVQAASPEGSRYREALDPIFGTLRRVPGVLPDRIEPELLPVCAHIDEALAIAGKGPPHIQDLGKVVGAIAPQLKWRTRKGAEAIGEPFLGGHANAYVVGPGGLEERSDVMVGLMLIAPNIRYPDHTHPPEEIYVSLAGGRWRNAAQDWTVLGTGSLFHNPPGIVHAVATGGTPALAIWCLWGG